MFRPFAITGLGIISAFGEGREAFFREYRQGASGLKENLLFTEKAYQVRQSGLIAGFNPKQYLRLDRTRGYGRLTLVLMEAMEELFRLPGFKPGADQAVFTGESIAAVIGTSGSIKTMSDFDFQVIEDPQFAQSSLFPGCVACSALGYSSIRNSIRAGNMTLVNGDTSSLDALQSAALLLANGEAQMVVVGGAEELSLPYALVMQNRFQHWGLPNLALGEGAVVFSCESREAAKARNAEVLGEILAYASCFSPELEVGVKYCLNQIAVQNPGILPQVLHCFGGEKCIFNCTEILDAHLPKKASYYTITDKIGYMFSAAGAFKIASALAEDAILAGELILITDISPEGNCSSLILRKN